MLAGLTARVKSPGHLYTTEGSVFEQSSVFACEGNALGDALIDDMGGDFGQAVDIAFPGAVVAAFDGIVKQAVYAVAVILIVFGGVDASLCGDTVRASRAVVESKALYVIAEFAE